MITKEFILNHLNTTNIVVVWILGGFLAFVVDVICLYIQSKWSLFFIVYLNNVLKNGPTNHQFIWYFLWPIYIPCKIFFTIYFFFEYKKYEYDDTEEKRLLEENKRLDKEMEEEKKLKKD